MPHLDSIPAQVLVSLIVCLVVFAGVQGVIAWLILWERKVVSWIQDRIGPNRVGPAGLLQPLADGIKLFFKEDYNPGQVDKRLFILAPAFIIIPALIGWAIVPWGGDWNFPGMTFWHWLPILGGAVIEPARVHVAAAGSVSVGIVYVIATASVGVYGVVLGGWASNSKYAFLGGLRAGAQMISYEIPLGVSILIVLLCTGSLRPDAIIASQTGGAWFLIAHPLAAAICFTAMLAEANRSPFDLAEAEQELVGGYHTEYSAMKWALFFFAEYGHMITSSAIFSILFLGGWHIFPFVPQSAAGGLIAVLLKVIVFCTKVGLLITFMMVIRWTLPRFRYDQLMNLAWRMLIPLSALLLVGTSVLVYMGRAQWWWMLGMNVLIGAAIYVAQPLRPGPTRPTRRSACSARASMRRRGEGATAVLSQTNADNPRCFTAMARITRRQAPLAR